MPRPVAEQQDMVAVALSAADWIVEGVFGQLAQSFLPHAQSLVWLDLPWPVCRVRLIKRLAGGAHLDRTQDSDAAAALLAWASEYDARSGSCSRAGHLGLFDAFSGEKTRLQSEEQTQAWLDARLAAY
ncbi:hypothetical protein [Chromobacterium sp. IIBBL 290-4]|uniref:hypothetical protein n=1 Tax=Chromobacterium sp. IIBBL 290-4 TaxID=2953890 RepID=UPI0020B7EBCC|nr:hypothetical protein [Chromobacterium sp. IIBBL 290-4]UTH73302.1 hypothetical protein NKT35_17445 [Chromobacterium sp. IIBBL 290-4]